MKKLVILFSLFILSTICFCQVNQNNHYVNGYTKSNGTYVQGYYRTNPNSTNVDNYSTYPNVNPYTGKTGTVTPDNYYSTPVLTIPVTAYISQSNSTSTLFDNNQPSKEELKQQWEVDQKVWRENQKEMDKIQKSMRDNIIEHEKEINGNPLNCLHKMLSEQAAKTNDCKKDESEILCSPFDITRPKNAKTFNVGSTITIIK